MGESGRKVGSEGERAANCGANEENSGQELRED